MQKKACLALVYLALVSLAQPSWATDVSLISTIRTIDARGDGRIVLTFHDESPNCLNASSPKFHYMVVGQNGMTEDGFKRAYATAMLAFALEKRVQVSFNSQSSACDISRILVMELSPP